MDFLNGMNRIVRDAWEARDVAEAEVAALKEEVAALKKDSEGWL